MKWHAFLQRKEEYATVWDDLKAEFIDNEMMKFLNGSYLVVVCKHYQMPFSLNDLVTIAVEHPEFIIEDKHSNYLLKLAAEFRSVKDRNQILANDILSKLHKMECENINIGEIRAEIRFPTVAIEKIQRIKQSKYVDHELTDMSKVSIRVILKH
jgi:hypothetical protein